MVNIEPVNMVMTGRWSTIIIIITIIIVITHIIHD